MMLGGFGFESRGFSYNDIGRRVNTQWADIPVASVLNRQQWTGPTSEEVTIRGVLFPVEFGGQASLDGIVAAATAGIPLMFVSGDAAAGLIHGMYTIQSVNEDRSTHTSYGDAAKNSYDITLKRYDETGADSAISRVLDTLLW
jgi:phage protein U